MLSYKEIFKTLKQQNNIKYLDLSCYRKLKKKNLYVWQDRLINKIENTSILSLAFLENNILACGTISGEIKLWDMDKEKPLMVLKEHKRAICSIAAISGNQFATASADKTIKIWDLEKQSCIVTLVGHTDEVRALIFKNGKLISGSADKTIKIWSIENQSCTVTCIEHLGAITSLSFYDDENFISGSEDKTIKLWSLANEKSIQTFSPESGSVHALLALPNTSIIAAGFANTSIQLLDLKTKEVKTSLKGHSSWISSLTQISGKYLASGSADHTIKIWDLETLTCINTLEHKNKVLTIASKNEALISATFEEFVNIWSCEPKLTYGDIVTILDQIQNQSDLKKISFQNARLKDEDVPALIKLLQIYPNIQHIDIRNTLISEASFEELYKQLVLSYPKSIIKIQHETMPYCYLDFSENVEFINANIKKEEASQNIIALANTGRQLILTEFNMVLDAPDLLDFKLIRKMFTEVCSVVDFRYPYTLLNIALSNSILTIENLESCKKELHGSLKWLAQNAMFNTDSIAAFKIILNTVEKNKMLTKFECNKLDSEAEDCKTFADPRFIDLRKQLMELQIEVKNLRTEVKLQMENLQSQINTVSHNVQLIANDLNQLKTALKRERKIRAVFSVAKFGLNLLTMGCIDVFGSCFDLSNFISISTALPLLKDLTSHQLEMIFDVSKGVGSELINKMLDNIEFGKISEKFIENWQEVRLVLLEIEVPVKDVKEQSSKAPTEQLSIQSTFFSNADIKEQFKKIIQKNLKDITFKFEQIHKELYITCEQLDSSNFLQILSKCLIEFLGAEIIVKSIIVDEVLKIKTHTPHQANKVADLFNNSILLAIDKNKKPL